jgi:hypothetical protein
MRKSTKTARKVATPKTDEERVAKAFAPRNRRGSTPADLGNEAAAAEVAMSPKQKAAAQSFTDWVHAAEPELTTLSVRFKLERETKGAVRFQEMRNGAPVEIGNGAVIGALYIRKDALNGAMPAWLDLTVSFDRSSKPAPEPELGIRDITPADLGIAAAAFDDANRAGLGDDDTFDALVSALTHENGHTEEHAQKIARCCMRTFRPR